MGKKSIVSEMGARVKGALGGSSSHHNEVGETRYEVRGSRQNMRGHHDGFEDVSDSEWLFGLVFLVLIIVALSPGVLLTIPPGRGGLFMSGNTSTIAAVVHAVILVMLLNFL